MDTLNNLVETWRLFFLPGYCVEVRALGVSGKSHAWAGFAGGVAVGYFNDEAIFTKAVAALDKTGQAEGIYITLNPVNPELLARANNRIVGCKKGDPTTSDVDIAKRRWLMIDIDPVRPAGISSTDSEITFANERADAVIEWLADQGFSTPTRALSGNGIHLLYRIEKPNDDESRTALSKLLKVISKEFSNEKVNIDTAVFNAARITKLYGTVARKGDATDTRKHRRSSLIGFAYMDEVNEIESTDLIADEPKPANKELTYASPSMERIESALAVLPAHFGSTGEGYNRWMSVLMAVQAELGESGIELCERYVPGQPGEIAAKFASFHRNGTTIATLFDLAKQYGWQPKSEKTNLEAYDGFGAMPDEDIEALLLGNVIPDLPFDLYDYRPEQGGVLDAWREHYSDKWIWLASEELWYLWRGTHWQSDRLGTLRAEIELLLDKMNREAEKRNEIALTIQDDDERNNEIKKAMLYLNATTRSYGKITSIESMATLNKAITSDMLNTKNTLNLSNGVFDLDTLTIRDRIQSDLFTYVLPYSYDPDAKCPRFVKFINEILVLDDGKTTDHKLVDLMQELIGYSLTTDTQYEVMIWLLGDGGNGKTVLINIIQNLLGPLTVGVDFQTLGMSGNYDLADLPDKRVAFSTESSRNGRIAETLLKKIVSGETIRARQIYGHPLDFKSVSKIWWGMNNGEEPATRGGHSMWRRLKLIPFNRIIKDSEKDIWLATKLRNELSGIFNWAMQGLERLRTQGHFTESKAAMNAIEEFSSSTNPVQQWLEERMVITEDIYSVSVRAAYLNYRDWCADTGHMAMNETNFGKELGKLQVQKKRMTAGIFCAFNFADAVNSENLISELGL